MTVPPATSLRRAAQLPAMLTRGGPSLKPAHDPADANEIELIDFTPFAVEIPRLDQLSPPRKRKREIPAGGGEPRD
ncbi:hypothetical protein [Lentzea aerocolonigenes]|uniref:hypothetical protein n=1 Tax=Lentzea aerocolonigenes TaxID=68170 RepID=UPI0012E0CC28|nr:hypothetical protein [Lentzea aerocolonigenes]